MDRESTVREAGLYLALEGWEDLDKPRMTNKAYQVGRMWAKTLEVEAGAWASMVSWKNNWQPGLARRVLLSSGENIWRGKFNYEDAGVRQMALNLMSPWRCTSGGPHVAIVFWGVFPDCVFGHCSTSILKSECFSHLGEALVHQISMSQKLVLELRRVSGAMAWPQALRGHRPPAPAAWPQSAVE